MRPVAIVATHPIQYQTPFFRYLAESGLPVRVLFLSRQGIDAVEDVDFGESVAWDLPLLHGFDHTFVPGFARPLRGRAADLVHPQLSWHLSGDRYSAVLVHGWKYLSMMFAVLGARANRLPLLYRAETTQATGSSGAKARALGVGLRASGAICLSIGSLNDRYYASIGIPATRRVLAPYAVDNDRFRAATLVSVAAARQRWNLQNTRRVVLFAGKLVEWKRPLELLEAFAAAASPEDALVFVGSGALRGELERRARSLSVDARFLGFVNQSEMPLVYRAADLLVLPSAHEPWGLAVNEAMAAGTPAMVSREVGCVPDLVVGDSGWVVDVNQPKALQSRLAQVLGNAPELARVAHRAQGRITQWGYRECAKGVREALSRVGCL